METRILDPWSGDDLDEILHLCTGLVESPEYPTVERWRQAGGKVVGHFQVYFPEELAHAAGLLPVKIRGGSIEPVHADSHFGSYLCSILKTSLELALSGTLHLDMFVAHPICDAARNLAAVWGRNTNYLCQILYLPQNPNSSHSLTYLRGEYARLLHDLEDVAERRVKPADLRRSLGVFNENRRLLRDLYRLRREAPWSVSVDESYVLMAVGGMIPREEHNRLLQAALRLLEERPAHRQERIRVLLEGGFCEQPPLDLLRALGRSCYVVDDDLLIGLRWLLEDVPEDGDIVENLARAYLECSSYSPVQHDRRKPKEKMVLERLRACDAEAAIITAAKMCEPGLEEQVTYTRAFDENDIPYFVSEFEENMTSFDQMEMQLETFVESLLFS